MASGELASGVAILILLLLLPSGFCSQFSLQLRAAERNQFIRAASRRASSTLRQLAPFTNRFKIKRMKGLRKCIPGNVKEKKRKRLEALKKSMAGSMDRYVVANNINSANGVPLDANDEEHLQEEMNVNEDGRGGNVNVNEDESGENVNDELHIEDLNANEDVNGENVDDAMDVEDLDENSMEIENANVNGSVNVCDDFYDPGNWKKHMSQNEIDLLVLRGPIRVTNGNYPTNDKSRSFNDSHFTRSLKNQETHDRSWLVYSNCADKVYCFCCVLFSHGVESNLTTATKGYNDWGNFSRGLSAHEKSVEHIANMKAWLETELRLKKRKTIDVMEQKALNREVEYWKEVLKRIFLVVKTLAKNNLAFRGKKEKIDDNNNGNFLGIIKMIAEFDPIMKEHLRRIRKKDISKHYLGHNIQNEMISLLGNEVKKAIVEKVKQAKYFSIILDCTPDASHEEQMTLVLRCVNVNSIEVEEYFIEFLKVVDTSGQGLYEVLKCALRDINLDFNNVRGQGYDNGSNMKGKNKGVQSRLLQEYPRALYIPCACHSLNLSLCDMALCRSQAKTFFGVIQRVYKLFAGSTKRWEILKQYVNGRGSKGLTLKLWTETRWESRIASVKAIRFQAPKIREALLHLMKHSEDATCVSDAHSLAMYDFQKFEFLVAMVIWYDILAQVNRVSKYLQSKDMEIGVAITLIKGLISFFEDYRDNGFENAKKEAEKIANEIGCEAKFEEKRVPKVKKFFDEVCQDEPRESNEELFRTHVFLAIMDNAITSLQERFQQFHQYEGTFAFLLDLEKLVSMNVEALKSSCMELENFLKDGDNFDIDGDDLFSELQLLRLSLPEGIKKPMEVLKYIKGMRICYPQAWIAYRVLLTIPVTVATAERSFSKLKLIKSYLRSTMSQERLNGLAMMSIEKKVLESIDCSKIISEFAEKKARKVKV